MLVRPLGAFGILLITGLVLLSGCGKDTPIDKTEDQGPPKPDEVLLGLQEIGYSCQLSQEITGLSGFPSVSYQDGNFVGLQITREDGITYINKDGSQYENSGFEPPIILKDEQLYVSESEGLTTLSDGENVVGSFDSITYPTGIYPELFIQVVQNGKQYQLVGSELLGPYQEIRQQEYHPETGRYYIFGQKEDGNWYYTDNSGEKQVSSKAYFSLVHDGSDVTQIHYADDQFPEKHLVVDGQRIDGVEKTFEIQYYKGRYTYRFEGDDGSYVRVGDQSFGPYDEVSPAHLSPDGQGYMYVFYRGDDKYLNVNGEAYGPYENLRGLHNFTYEHDSYFTYGKTDPNQDFYEKLFHDQMVPVSAKIEGMPIWYGQFSEDGKDWIYYIQEDDKWYPLINGEKSGSGYQEVKYHMFAKEEGGNAVSVIAQDTTGNVLWSDGSETRRANMLDAHDDGRTKVLIFEYKGKKIIELNEKRLGIYDHVDEVIIDGDKVFVAYELNNETFLLDGEAKYGPYPQANHPTVYDGKIFSASDSILSYGDESIYLGAPILYVGSNGNLKIGVLKTDDTGSSYHEYTCR